MSKEPDLRLTPLAIAVLALLKRRPMHPYEMYQLMLSRRQDYLVKIGPGSLYHTVARLADQRLVRVVGTDRAGKRPERTTYRMTEAGGVALRSKLSQIIRTPIREYPIFALGVFEANELPKDEVLELFSDRVRHLESEIEEMTTACAWSFEHRVPRRYWMVSEYLLERARIEADWLRGIIADLESGRLEWEKFDATTGLRCTDSPDSERSESGCRQSIRTRCCGVRRCGRSWRW